MANRAPGTIRLAAVVAVAQVIGCAHASDVRRPPPAAGYYYYGTREPIGSTAPQPPHDSAPHAGDGAFTQEGYASWYGAALAGHKMANGKPFDPSRMTAAHLKLKLGTWVEVQRVDTGQTVRVCITDRGPYGHADRIIDLSRAAADRIGLVKMGLAKVQIRVVEGP